MNRIVSSIGRRWPRDRCSFRGRDEGAIRVDNQAKENKTEGEERMMVYCWKRGEKI